MRNLRRFSATLLLASTAATTLPAHGQGVWTVTNLHPAGARASRLIDTDGSQQVGNITVGEVRHAGLWFGSAASFVDLHPALAQESNALGVGGGQQAGYAILDDKELPAVWSGSANSLRSFLPNGVPAGRLFSTTGVQQGGQIDFPTARAIVWSGEAENLVNLHPPVATQSGVRDSNGSRQVGFAIIGASQRAAMWGGSRDSFIDMNPPGAVASTAEDIESTQRFDVQMVGHAIIGGVLRASMWVGQANGYRDLHPAGAISSQAFATDGTHQVGLVRFAANQQPRAALWRGDAGSFVDLHALLPPVFSTSDAAGVWTDGTTTLVAGAAFNTATARFEAILWRLAPRPAPTVRVLGRRTRETAARRILIRGSTTEAERVEVKVGSGNFRPAVGTAAWSFRASLKPGRNRIVIRASHSAASVARTATIIVTRK